jgi:hypothetical protein
MRRERGGGGTLQDSIIHQAGNMRHKLGLVGLVGQLSDDDDRFPTCGFFDLALRALFRYSCFRGLLSVVLDEGTPPHRDGPPPRTVSQFHTVGSKDLTTCSTPEFRLLVLYFFVCQLLPCWSLGEGIGVGGQGGGGGDRKI